MPSRTKAVQPTIYVDLPRPYHIQRMLMFLRSSSLRTPYLFHAPHEVARLVYWQNRPIIVAFDFQTTRRQLRVTGIPENPLDSGERRALTAFLHDLATGIWGLRDDLRRCYRTFRADPLLGSLLPRMSGLRLMRTPDLYEALIMGVIGQQLSVIAASAIRGRLMRAGGVRLAADGREYWGYPPPTRLLAMSPDTLRAAGVGYAKVRFLKEIAARAAGGYLDRARFELLDDEDAIQQLIEIPGVGRWTAEIALMRGHGRQDIFPAADLGLIVGMQRLLRKRLRPTEQQLRALTARWAGVAQLCRALRVGQPRVWKLRP